MPQHSIPYAVARVRAIGSGVIGQAAMERLVQAGGMEETLKALSDMGFPAETRQMAEEAAEENLRKACDDVRALSPEPRITDCFLYRYDGLNLKTLLKARSLGLNTALLSQCGTVKPDLLRHAVAEANYKALPPFLKQAAEAADKMNAAAFDPLKTDALIDRAVYGHIQEELAGEKCPEAKEYFAAEADLTNLLIALRARTIGWKAQMCGELYLPGGKLSHAKLNACLEDPAQCKKAAKGQKWEGSIPALYQDPISLFRLEKEADDYKTRLLRSHRHDVGNILPLIGYLVARERESMAIRLILTARSAGVGQEALMERLREAYVR